MRQTVRVRRSITLRTQLLLWQLGIVLFVVSATMATALAIQWYQLRDAYLERALGIAHAVAELPTVREAFEHEMPADSIQPIAELIRQASGMTYVVVTDAEGIRYSHPNPDRIGERVSTDPSVALSGKVFTGKETGTLGDTWRAKVPVFGESGEVIGQVSVGILDAELRADILAGLPWQLATTVIVAAVSGLGAIFTARIFRRRTLGLEPEQIAGLLEGREAILHGSRDGIVAVDTSNTVALINDAARDMLGVAPEESFEGVPAADLLDQDLAAQLRAADGEERLMLLGEKRVLVRADPVSHLDHPTGTVLLMRDHTDLHRTIVELEGAQSLTTRLQTQSHEFQNQLHVIGGLLQIGDAQAASEFVRRLSQGGELPQLDAQGDIDIELGALLLVKRGAAREREIRFESHGVGLWPSAEEVSMNARDDLLGVVGNLLDNALDASAAGDSVRLQLRRQERALWITVSDSGAGVAVADRERIFSAGVSTKAADGTRGFGLPLVRRIAERFGGSVSVRESVLGGAAFEVHVLLPPAGERARDSPGGVA